MGENGHRGAPGRMSFLISGRETKRTGCSAERKPGCGEQVFKRSCFSRYLPSRTMARIAVRLICLHLLQNMKGLLFWE